MSASPPAPVLPPSFDPVRYEASMESLDEGEAQTNAALIETITKIQTKVYEDSGHAMRGVHSKCHGVVVGELRVLEGLPSVLAQGLFAAPAVHPVVMRFSTIPGDVLDDNVSVPRGLALKVLGVSGARCPGSEGDSTQDFVFGNGPVFSKGHPSSFLSTLKLLAGTTDKVPNLKKVLSTVMRGAEKIVEGVGGKSPTLLTLGGYPETHILGDPFYSQTPILFGAYMAKVALKPYSAALRALSHAAVDLKDRPNGLREAVAEFFRSNAGEWELQVQLCTDIAGMPLEDASKEWSEEKSPYVSIAHISIPPQESWSSVRVQVVDERMSFSPWHALAAHRPLGAINRVRKTVYDTGAKFRAQRNHVAPLEPHSLDELH